MTSPIQYKTRVGLNSSEFRCLLPRFQAKAQLIADGEITEGVINPVGCVVVATGGHNSLAMLKRRPGETLTQLLIRLDQAIERAWIEEIYVDEINPPASHTFRAGSKPRG